MSPRSLQDFPFHAEVTSGVLAVRAAGHQLASDAERRDLLERVRAGEHVELELDAVTYIQRDTPNRNGVRFKPGILQTLAKSGVGQPFLLDHAQGDSSKRGGTIIKSKAEKRDGEWVFVQTLKLVKPWAVEGVLDGTIDRFSIGWHPSGPVVYRHSGDPIEAWPKHWPLDVLDDGTVVEWVFTAAQLVETSGVNVPAVTGTHPEGIRAALAAHLGGSPPPSTRPPEGQKDRPMKNLLKALGLSPDAAEESAVEAVAQLQAERDQSRTELEAERAARASEQAELETHRAFAAELAAAELDRRIEQLYAEGRLVHGTNPANPQERSADPMEANLRELHAAGGLEMFEKFATSLRPKVPVRQTPAAAGALSGSGANTPTANGDKVVQAGDVTIVLDARRRHRMRRMGLSEESYQRYADKLAAQRAEEGR